MDLEADNTRRSERELVRDALAAIETLRTSERHGNVPTADERATLLRFPGFGPIARIFPDPGTGAHSTQAWADDHTTLRGLLSAEAYDEARRATFSAFYTPATIATAMIRALVRAGLPEDARVLEPGCGTGRLMALAPAGWRFTGIEAKAPGSLGVELTAHRTLALRNAVAEHADIAMTMVPRQAS